MISPFADNRADYIILLADLRRNHSVLTIGVSNIPEIEKKIENKVKNCVCMDIDIKKVNNAKKHLKKTDFIIWDITRPNKKWFKKFDTIIMLEVLEHIEKDGLALQNVHNMLKKDGKLIISVPNKHPIHLINPVKYTQHKRHYSMNEITKLLRREGFKIKFTNTVESLKLILDLYVHLFCKYILRKKVPFGLLTGKKDKTYRGLNELNKGLDCLVVGFKD